MGILAIILGILLIISIGICIILWNFAFDYYVLAKMQSDPKSVIGEYLSANTEKEFPCTLLLSLKEGAEFDGTIYDFSSYEEKKIIGLTQCQKEMTENQKYTDEDGEPMCVFMPNQKVLLMKDGSYQWDFRSLM